MKVLAPFLVVWHGMQRVGLFVSSIINYLLLAVVYVVGVGFTWLLVRSLRKQLLNYQKPSWSKLNNKNASLEKARRLF